MLALVPSHAVTPPTPVLSSVAALIRPLLQRELSDNQTDPIYYLISHIHCTQKAFLQCEFSDDQKDWITRQPNLTSVLPGFTKRNTKPRHTHTNLKSKMESTL